MSKLITHNVLFRLANFTTTSLRTKQANLQTIHWRDGESNLDTGFSELACQCCIEAWKDMQQQVPEYQEVELKAEPPDINLTFNFPEGKTETHHIELKSSKDTVIPGSTIGKLDINQPLIFCLRPKTGSEEYQFRAGPYYLAMGETEYDKFQDRTPRPPINFNKMPEFLDLSEEAFHYPNRFKKEWISRYARCAMNRVSDSPKCKPSWQDDLIREIQKRTLEEFIDSTTELEFNQMKQKLKLRSRSLKDNERGLLSDN